jgi:septal ring factor EnvC (AmiA/AmiB activator)
MQPYQYALAAGIGWMITLIILPFLIAKARRHAYARGFEAGKAFHDQTLSQQLKEAKQALNDVRAELQRTQQTCNVQLAARQASIAALKENISELEARIMSYTGLAVTKADYEKLVSASATMRLAQRTFNALKSGAEATRAGAQADAIDELAKRIHAQLRSTPASTAPAGAAA